MPVLKSARIKRNPVPTADDLCQYDLGGELCGTPYAQTHEVFFGTANRQKSIQHGMQIRLCDTHHKYAHADAAYQEELHVKYQRMFEKRLVDYYGFAQEEVREIFKKEFGRNYLDL